MGKPVYIVVGNHYSLSGIQEIVYGLHTCLSRKFSVRVERAIQNNAINVIIDEFVSAPEEFDLKRIKELHPQTKVIVVATEFVTPISVLGMGWRKTFNFFGDLSDWQNLLIRVLKPSAEPGPTYMHHRYVSFVHALKHCDLLLTVHTKILPTLASLADHFESLVAPPIMIYPEIGSLSAVQWDRLRDLPVGFTMTGRTTPYRRKMTRELLQTFKSAGLSTPAFKYLPFENLPTSSPLNDIAAWYNSTSIEYLFNFNPPQHAKWPYSSPMRILRAILLGQVPVVTKKYDDHLIESVARLWDGRTETAREFASLGTGDRQGWLTNYVRSIEAYDQLAQGANKMFIDAMMALTDRD